MEEKRSPSTRNTHEECGVDNENGISSASCEVSEGNVSSMTGGNNEASEIRVSEVHARAGRIRTMCEISLGAALLAVGAFLSIPFTIPITLQTLVLFALAGCLGSRKTIYATAVYLFIGSIGCPIFAGFRGGPAVLLGPTGGFLVGFLFIPLLYGLSEKILARSARSAKLTRSARSTISPKKNTSRIGKAEFLLSMGALVVGLLLCYATGTIWFAFGYSQKGIAAIGSAISICVIPFIVPDLIKLAVAQVICTITRPYFMRLQERPKTRSKH